MLPSNPLAQLAQSGSFGTPAVAIIRDGKNPGWTLPSDTDDRIAERLGIGKAVQPASVPADERQASRIVGKGWTVSRSKNKKSPYLGHAQKGGRRVVDGTPMPRWEKKEDAVRYAIAHAHKAGTLDWKKTMHWLELMALQVDVEGIEVSKIVQRQKGWYLSAEKGGKYYQIMVGKSYDESLYWGIGATPYVAFRKAVDMGLMSEPYFDYDSSIIWLERKGYDDCVKLLKKKKAS